MALQGDQLAYKDGASLVEAPVGSGLPARRVTVVNDTPISVDISGPIEVDVTVGDSINADIRVDGRPVDGSNPVPVSVIGGLSVTVSGDSITSGTVDGTAGGTERTFVNNRKSQVLAAHDLAAAYTWLDFGTKNERVSTIVYTSATFTGVTVTRTFAYSLVSGAYRLDSETWSTSPGG